MKKVALHNLGCKVNAYETEAMQQMLSSNGYEIVPFKEGADVYIINTCTVTNMADRKSRQMIHRAKKMNPDAIVVAAGCYVQTAEGAVDDCIDIIVGNNHKKDIVEILRQYEREKLDVRLDINHTNEYEDMNLYKTAEHTRAYIKVQDGCNQFCTYCIIPFARGRVRSRSVESVLQEVRTLAGNGYKEVVLTGIHLSSYGVDFKEDECKDDLLSLICKVHEVEGIERIRLGSLEPRIVTEEFAETLSKLPKMCPHFHLSLQSGCDETLKRMNRRYSAQEYSDKCDLLRKYFKNPALTTDVIVGFPGETEEEFEKSFSFIDKIDFYETHIFKYSKREGTKAAVMKDQVPEEIKTKRSNRLIALNEQKQRKYEENIVGTNQEVLFEELVEMADGTFYVGHTKEYIKIREAFDRNVINEIVNIENVDSLQIIH